MKERVCLGLRRSIVRHSIKQQSSLNKLLHSFFQELIKDPKALFHWYRWLLRPKIASGNFKIISSLNAFKLLHNLAHCKCRKITNSEHTLIKFYNFLIQDNSDLLFGSVLLVKVFTFH